MVYRIIYAAGLYTQESTGLSQLNISHTDISDYSDPTDAIYKTFIPFIIPRQNYSAYEIPPQSSKTDNINQVEKNFLK